MRGISTDEADRVIAAQMPAERKRGKSDFVIENERSLKQLERQARTVFDELRHRAAVAALGGRPARPLLLAAAEAPHQLALNAVADRYADAGLSIRRATVGAAALAAARGGRPRPPDASVRTAASVPSTERTRL